jgi:SAM-dependent methyltransferase
MQAIFEHIYAINEWRYGSGEGSLPINNRGYIRFLQRFMRQNNVRSVLDLGCGDWQFSRLIDWTGIDYLGLDVARPVLAENRAKYARPGVHFEEAPEDFAGLPAADLLLCKDVLQHWPYADIDRLLPQLPRFRFALITNCVRDTIQPTNVDMPVGHFRALDLRLPPFNCEAEAVYGCSPHLPWWKRLNPPPQPFKATLLFRGAPAAGDNAP